MSGIDALKKLAEHRHISTQRQHLLLCTAGKCSSPELAEESWSYLKCRIKELGLMDVESGVYRSKVDCLRVCRQGPIMVSYPDGTWYHSCSPEVIERILQEHVLQGKPVLEYSFAEGDLGACI
ncbi:MAG: (2Fe-2S) ferredoxin domain-containing protein [Porticoccaceae bacterium]|jgi:(2Fe-2S) ferredoxin